MPKSIEKEKNFTLLEKNVQVISAVNNQKLSPYLDTFRHHPENILSQPLGILAGFFKINDLSEDSAYIVNFLSSVVKKEYFINPKRPVETSLDSALRKINLAISEIAKAGNIKWLGKIDGAVCVLEKNNLHFSVCGQAKILLLRNQILTEISKDVAYEENDPNPIKTFVNVSSGRLEKDDKIIISGQEIFEVFSLSELKKGAVHFPGEKFTQFIKTALTNKLEIVGTIIVDIFEKEISQKNEDSEISSSSQYNVFSQKTFENNIQNKKNIEDLLREDKKNEYTDEKTGHIYIQEDETVEKNETKKSIFWFLLKEKMLDFSFWMKKNSRKAMTGLGIFLKGLSMNIWIKLKNWKIERKLKIAETKKEKISSLSDKSENRENPETAKNEVAAEKSLSFGKIIPDFNKISTILNKITLKQKIVVIFGIFFIFAIPFVFVKIQGSRENKNANKEFQETIPDKRELLSGEKNIIFLENIENFGINYPLENATAINGRVVANNQEKIIIREESGEIKEVEWKKDEGLIKNMVAMKDLNLVLILTDKNKIFSLPLGQSSAKITENKISIPENSNLTGMATYLTYLYLLDAKNNQIYRYPRAEGGFGEKSDWIKDSLDLESACCLSIEENVFLKNKDTLKKLFKGRNQDFVLEQTAVPVKVDRIFTNEDIGNLYILDKDQGRIIQFSKDGTLIRQYFNEAIKESTGFSADEKSGSVYFSNSQGLNSFRLEQL